MINKNIQIMRTIALIMVVFFHLELKVFNIGYLGVDIFFVISGFLMPIIISKYTPYTYIKARFIRLYPTLAFATLISLIVGYFLLMPGELKSLALASLSSLSFSSNYYFLLNTGYFDIDSKLQILLHTWSLSNEFQAYLLVFISWLFFSKNKLVLCCWLFLFLSLFYIFNVDNISYLNPVPRLYLFFIAFVISDFFKEKKLDSKLLPLISLFFVVICYLLFGDEILSQQWPNYGIIFLPFIVIPFLLMKECIIPDGYVQRLFVKIGDWSYSIYIWHWIVITGEFVFLRNTAITSYKEVIVLLVPSVFVGVFSFYYIERNKRLSLISTILIFVFIPIFYFSNGADYRVKKEVIPYSNLHKMVGVEYIKSEDTNGFKVDLFQSGNGFENVLVVGDSFSQHILPMLKHSREYGDKTIYKISVQPRELISGWGEMNNIIKNKKIKKVIISYNLQSKSSSDIKKLAVLLNEPSDFYKVVIRGIPDFEKDLVSCFIKKHSSLKFIGCDFDIDTGIPLNKVHNEKEPNWFYLDENKTNYKTLDSHRKLCDSKSCRLIINNEFIMRDKIHFNEKLSSQTNTELGNILFSPKFNS